MGVRIEKSGRVTTVILARPERRNAIDGATATALASAFRTFDADPDTDVAVLWGEGGHFCGGADLKAFAGNPGQMRLSAEGDAPLGVSRMLLSKPVIAAVSGYAVAGGLELACWCDLRVAEESAVFGVFCRRFGVPLIDGGTVRLARLIGHSRALDLILTGRAVRADEAFGMGLVNRVVPFAELRAETERWCRELLEKSPTALRLAKQSFNMDSEQRAGVGEFATTALNLYYQTEEAQEGRNAFVEKRPVDFSKFRK
jgi:enoyl-CoA hydratase